MQSLALDSYGAIIKITEKQ